MMKRLITILVVLLPLVASAQGKITTKKYRIADFRDKVTKVVLTGNEVMDSALKQEIITRWSASPYEFATAAEFEALKSSDAFYFLLITNSFDKDENNRGIEFLSLVKGGPEAAKGLEAMTDVATIPLRPDGISSGREFVYLPALIDILQAFASAAMDTDFKGYAGLGVFNVNFRRSGATKRIYISEDDLSEKVDQQILEKYLDEDMLICDEDDADAVFMDGELNTLVSYVVSPESPAPGKFFYAMLISSDTHELYYYKKYKISRKAAPGFLESDFKILSSIR